MQATRGPHLATEQRESTHLPTIPEALVIVGVFDAEGRINQHMRRQIGTGMWAGQVVPQQQAA